ETRAERDAWKRLCESASRRAGSERPSPARSREDLARRERILDRRKSPAARAQRVDGLKRLTPSSTMATTHWLATRAGSRSISLCHPPNAGCGIIAAAPHPRGGPSGASQSALPEGP